MRFHPYLRGNLLSTEFALRFPELLAFALDLMDQNRLQLRTYQVRFQLLQPDRIHEDTYPQSDEGSGNV